MDRRQPTAGQFRWSSAGVDHGEGDRRCPHSLSGCPQAKCNVNGDMPTKKSILARRKNLQKANECKKKLSTGKRSSAYFSQVQCQRAQVQNIVTSNYVWSLNGEAVKGRICVDAEFWASKVEKLKLFFDECLLPEIVDLRKCRNMPKRASFTPRPESLACSVKRKLTRS